MKHFTTGFLTIALISSSGLLASQQQSPTPTNPSQGSQDVPHQKPGTNNPDLQSERKSAPGKSSQSGGGNSRSDQSGSDQSNSSGTKTPDVPHQQPGTDNPDLGKGRQPTPGSSSSTAAKGATKSKKKGRKAGAGSDTTSTTHQL